MYLMYLLILILCFKGSNSAISTYYHGYLGLNFLCGCERDNQNDKNITIKCADGKVIQIEYHTYFIRDSIRSDRDCGSFNYSRCSQTFKPNILNLEDRIEVYKKCSRQNSCNIKIGGVEDGQQRLVNYPFDCHTESSIIDLSQKTVKTINHPIFYFTGEKLTGQKIDCDCSVTDSSSNKLDLVIYFIYLKPNTSSRVRFLTHNFTMFESSFNGITSFYTSYSPLGPELKLEIRGMEPDKDDVIFVRFWGYKISVNCSGCTNTTESSITDLSEKTVKKISNPIFYFTGEKFTGQKIDCDCSVTGSDQIGSEIFFIHLKPNTFAKIQFLSQNFHLFESLINGIKMLYTNLGYIGTELKLEIRGMEPDKDDVIFFKVWGPNLSVKCSGCTNSTVLPSTKPQTSNSTKATSPNKTNDGTIAALGGILGAVIIIVLVGVTIYCFLRYRKEQQKKLGSNAPGNDEKSHYDYPDLPQSRPNYLTVSETVQYSDQRE